MRVRIVGCPHERGNKIHVDFEVWCDEHEPQFEGNLLGTLNHDYKLNSTPEELAKLIWQDALAYKEEAILFLEFCRDVRLALRDRMARQVQ